MQIGSFNCFTGNLSVNLTGFWFFLHLWLFLLLLLLTEAFNLVYQTKKSAPQ